MKDGKITIITAFFDCGRGNNKKQQRSNQKYFEYFKFWARIKNELIVYTSQEFEEEIKKIRSDFGRQNETKVIVIDDIYSIESDILRRMQEIQNKNLAYKYRYRVEDISNDAKYDYIMLMKYWCMQDAVGRGITSSMLSWIDFGWNHGGETYTVPEEFDFEWKYSFSEKIHLFSLSNPEKDVGIIRLMSMSDSIMGPINICPANKAGQLFMACKEAMEGLLSLDCFDDDQMLLRMAVKRHPEKFEIHITDWFLPMKEYGGGHLTAKKRERKNKNVSIIFTIKNKLCSILNRQNGVEKDFIHRLSKAIQEECII